MISAHIREAVIAVEVLDRAKLDVTKRHEAQKVVLLHNHGEPRLVVVHSKVIKRRVLLEGSDAIRLEVLSSVEGLVLVAIGVLAVDRVIPIENVRHVLLGPRGFLEVTQELVSNRGLKRCPKVIGAKVGAIFGHDLLQPAHQGIVVGRDNRDCLSRCAALRGPGFRC